MKLPANPELPRIVVIATPRRPRCEVLWIELRKPKPSSTEAIRALLHYLRTVTP